MPMLMAVLTVLQGIGLLLLGSLEAKLDESFVIIRPGKQVRPYNPEVFYKMPPDQNDIIEPGELDQPWPDDRVENTATPSTGGGFTATPTMIAEALDETNGTTSDYHSTSYVSLVTTANNDHMKALVPNLNDWINQDGDSQLGNPSISDLSNGSKPANASSVHSGSKTTNVSPINLPVLSNTNFAQSSHSKFAVPRNKASPFVPQQRFQSNNRPFVGAQQDSFPANVRSLQSVNAADNFSQRWTQFPPPNDGARNELFRQNIFNPAQLRTGQPVVSQQASLTMTPRGQIIQQPLFQSSQLQQPSNIQSVAKLNGTPQKASNRLRFSDLTSTSNGIILNSGPQSVLPGYRVTGPTINQPSPSAYGTPSINRYQNINNGNYGVQTSLTTLPQTYPQVPSPGYSGPNIQTYGHSSPPGSLLPANAQYVGSSGVGGYTKVPSVAGYGSVPNFGGYGSGPAVNGPYSSGPINGGSSNYGVNQVSNSHTHPDRGGYPNVGGQLFNIAGCYLRYPDSIVVNYAPFERVGGLTLEECLMRCLSSSGDVAMTCASAVYVPKMQTCDLYNISVDRPTLPSGGYGTYGGYMMSHGDLMSTGARLMGLYGYDYYRRTGKCNGYTNHGHKGGYGTVTTTTPRPSTVGTPLPGTVCPAGKVTLFYQTNGFELLGSDGYVVNGISEDDCVNYCLSNLTPDGSTYYCLSLDYMTDTQTCILTSEAASPTRAGVLIDNSANVYYEKVCVDATLAANCRSDIDRQSQSVLEGSGVNVQTAGSSTECIESCLNAQAALGLTCRSILFFYEEDDFNCVLNSETRITDPGNFKIETDVRVEYYGLDTCFGSANPVVASRRRRLSPHLNRIKNRILARRLAYGKHARYASQSWQSDQKTHNSLVRFLNETAGKEADKLRNKDIVMNNGTISSKAEKLSDIKISQKSDSNVSTDELLIRPPGLIDPEILNIRNEYFKNSEPRIRKTPSKTIKTIQTLPQEEAEAEDDEISGDSYDYLDYSDYGGIYEYYDIETGYDLQNLDTPSLPESGSQSREPAKGNSETEVSIEGAKPTGKVDHPKAIATGEWDDWGTCDKKTNGRRIRYRLCGFDDNQKCPAETEWCNKSEKLIFNEEFYVSKPNATAGNVRKVESSRIRSSSAKLTAKQPNPTRRSKVFPKPPPPRISTTKPTRSAKPTFLLENKIIPLAALKVEPSLMREVSKASNFSLDNLLPCVSLNGSCEVGTRLYPDGSWRYCLNPTDHNCAA